MICPLADHGRVTGEVIIYGSAARLEVSSLPTAWRLQALALASNPGLVYTGLRSARMCYDVEVLYTLLDEYVFSGL